MPAQCADASSTVATGGCSWRVYAIPSSAKREWTDSSWGVMGSAVSRLCAEPHARRLDEGLVPLFAQPLRSHRTLRPGIRARHGGARAPHPAPRRPPQRLVAVPCGLLLPGSQRVLRRDRVVD